MAFVCVVIEKQDRCSSNWYFYLKMQNYLSLRGCFWLHYTYEVKTCIFKVLVFETFIFLFICDMLADIVCVIYFWWQVEIRSQKILWKPGFTGVSSS